MRNIEYLEYTFEHRRAFQYAAREIFGSDPLYTELASRAEMHDMDKAYLYSLTDKAAASTFHKLVADHHIENGRTKSRVDLMEAFIDWDCAGYTKEDKPDCAWDALRRLRPAGGEALGKIARDCGRACSYLVSPTDPGWLKFSAPAPTRSRIVAALSDFAFSRPVVAARLRKAARDIELAGPEYAAKMWRNQSER